MRRYILHDPKTNKKAVPHPARDGFFMLAKCFGPKIKEALMGS
jgi:hypothetical protein